MLPPKTRWSVGSPDPALVNQLSETFQIRPLLAALLAARGCTVEEAAFFLSETPVFHDPYLMKGMAEAVERIQAALNRQEKLLIYGDYDADGVSSTALLVRLFRSLGADLMWRVPHRVHDGYGLHAHYLEEAKAAGVSLVVTVDTGITAVEQSEEAKRLGLDLIVTDHHEPPEMLPDALALINPKQSDCTYPFDGLAGVGVAFKLAQALLGRVPEELAAYAALGTIADLMPLVGENRSIVKLGLEQIRFSPPPGLSALLRTAGVRSAEANEGTIGFAIGPRLNAAGRLESADNAVKLLLADDAEQAEPLARHLDALNRERQEMVDAAAAEAIEMAEREGGPGSSIVVFSDHWNPGIIGIVASRLVEKFYRPVVVIAFDPETGEGKGSARSIPGFHLYNALKTCDHLFDHFGGHESAAGLTLHWDKLEAFREAFEQHAAGQITPEMMVPVTAADTEIDLGDVTLEAVAELDKLAPYGMDHPAPKFAVRGVTVVSAACIGKDKRHAKFRLSNGQVSLDAVAFGFGEAVPRIAGGSQLDLIGEVSINEWNGRRVPQMIIKDLSVPHLQLFDWRDALSRTALMARWNLAASDDWQPAFLIGQYGTVPSEAAPLWPNVPAYRIMRSGERMVEPANAAARRIPFDQVTDLFLIYCPFPYERFYHILDSYNRLARIYALAVGEGSAVLDRPRMAKLYMAVRRLSEGTEESWIRTLEDVTGFDAFQARLAVQVFKELQFVEPGSADGTLRVVASPSKRDLNASPTYSAAQQAALEDQAWRTSSFDSLRRKLLRQAERRTGNGELIFKAGG